MGNKLCKKRVDVVDNPKSPFDRIITRLHLRPNSWKSDSSLSDKQVNRYEINPKNGSNPIPPPRPRPLSSAKSTEWTTATLEVSNDYATRNPRLSTMFNDNTTPTPPPRKHKKNLREKIESVAKSGLQAFQSKKPVEEPLHVKRTIHYGCPACDGRDNHHNHDHNNHTRDKEKKRAKNLSIVSLPNYNELKLSVASPDKALADMDSTVNASHLSLPGENKKLSTVSTPGKLENYMTRCRSFGSLLPNQLLNKLKPVNAPADVESDDSFGGLEDWDLRIIEHYNPKDASLPRPRKPIAPAKSDSAILADIESMLVKDEPTLPPMPPVRRSESMLKKMTREASETARKISTEMLHIDDDDDDASIETRTKSQNKEGGGKATPLSITPPPSPEPEIVTAKLPAKFLPIYDDDGNVEHSGLIKILEEFSIRDAQKNNDADVVVRTEELTVKTSNNPFVDSSSVVKDLTTGSLPPSRYNVIVDFLNAERCDVRSACPK